MNVAITRVKNGLWWLTTTIGADKFYSAFQLGGNSMAATAPWGIWDAIRCCFTWIIVYISPIMVVRLLFQAIAHTVPPQGQVCV